MNVVETAHFFYRRGVQWRCAKYKRRHNDVQMKGKNKQKHIKMVYRRQSARKHSGLNSRQIKRGGKNKIENKVLDNIRSNKHKVKKLLICRWILTIFGVLCALISSCFGLFSSDMTNIFFDFTSIFVFCIVIDLFIYLKK